jgi:hypothetical protein
LSEAFKICPICDTANHRNAAVCISCGTSLTSVSAVAGGGRTETSSSHYDYRFGETDLLEDSLRSKAQRYLAIMLITLLLVMSGGLALMFAPQISQATASVSTRVNSIAFVTNTPRPTLALPTVTVGPPTLPPSRTPLPSPTPTFTASPEPCRQEVQPEDGLYAIVLRCGHRDLFVITEVMLTNSMSSDTDIRAGQIIDVPWPTGTPDPNATEEPVAGTDEVAFNADGEEITIDFNATLIADPFYRPTQTLPPNVMYHTVSPDDNAIVISQLYDTNVEVLSQLNPEITFSQCDYGERFGGPRCIIPLGVGQQIRVPAPTPTSTLSPTPSGSETRTPTPTATFNAPSPRSPSNRAFVRRDEVVTLRWTASGILEEGQAYLVTVERLNDGQVFTGNSNQLHLVLPVEWQGTDDERYEYSWTISVIDLDNPSQLNHTTQPLTFTWQGRGEEN